MNEPFDLNLDVAAATLRSGVSDVHLLLKMLVNQLSGALADRMAVVRKGGLFRKSDDIRSVEIEMGDDVFRADLKGSDVACSIAHSSGGIRIRNEPVEMQDWLVRLLRCLQAEATHSQDCRQALEQLVIGGPQ
jgi:hypothetical protein